MRIAIIGVALFGATLAGCATARSSCDDPAPLSGVLEGLPEPQQLQSALRQVVRAHCLCEFSSDVREIIPNGIDGHGSWEDVNASCLGPIEIVEWSRGDNSLIAIYVLQKGKYEQEFFERHLIMANFVDQRWSFSWPASLGKEWGSSSSGFGVLRRTPLGTPSRVTANYGLPQGSEDSILSRRAPFEPLWRPLLHAVRRIPAWSMVGLAVGALPAFGFLTYYLNQD